MTESKTPIRTLALGKSVHGETIVLRHNYDSLNWAGLESFCRHHSLRIIDSGLAHTIILSTLEPQLDRASNTFLYGGRAFNDVADRLVMNAEDIHRYGLTASDLRTSNGEFHLTEICNSSIKFSADYFGLQPLFIYETNDIQSVSSNYHLLLLLLKLLGVDLQLDVSRSLEMLNEDNVFGSGKSIEMANCRINDIEERFEFTVEGLSAITNAELHDQLHDSSQTFNVDQYRNLIVEARDEIVNNVRRIFEYDGFSEVIVDLSGGLDSRLIYGACTVLSQKMVRQKIRINSQFGPSPNAKSGGDLEIGALVNSLYNYRLWEGYDDESAHYVELPNYMDTDKFYVNKISRLFGTHKNYNHVVPKHVDYYVSNITRLSGFIGEVYRGANFISSHGDKMSHINNYTNSRNRYMAARPFENILSPLASKKLLKASRMYQWNQSESLTITPEMDALTAINPLLTMIPFYNPDLREFLASVDHRDLYNFPHQIKIETTMVSDPSSTVAKTKEKSNPYSRFVFDLKYVESMLDTVESFHPDYAAFVSEFRCNGSDMVKDRHARVLSMLWSIYFQIQIIQGNGDVL